MRAKVFLDKVSPRVLKTVRSCVEARFESADYIPCERGLVAAWHEGAHRLQAPRADTFTCFVTESQTLQDADVAYAVFVARIPSLTLQPCEPLSPLLAAPVGQTAADEAAERLIRDFFTFPEERGKVLVIEGGDGAGKETQTKMLVERLRRDGVTVKWLDFPHDAAPYGDLVRVVLSGKKGGISDLDPRLFSFIYSLNRYGCLPELRYWTTRGFTVVLDRYYTANFGHQASKLPEGLRKDFVHHLERCEVDWLGLPRADRVFYLDLPSKVALEAMKKDTTRAYLDIHETAGSSYKEGVRLTYLWCCKELNAWKGVPCCDADGSRRSREELHNEIYTEAKKVLAL